MATPVRETAKQNHVLGSTLCANITEASVSVSSFLVRKSSKTDLGGRFVFVVHRASVKAMKDFD